MLVLIFGWMNELLYHWQTQTPRNGESESESQLGAPGVYYLPYVQVSLLEWAGVGWSGLIWLLASCQAVFDPWSLVLDRERKETSDVLIGNISPRQEYARLGLASTSISKFESVGFQTLATLPMEQSRSNCTTHLARLSQGLLIFGCQI